MHNAMSQIPYPSHSQSQNQIRTPICNHVPPKQNKPNPNACQPSPYADTYTPILAHLPLRSSSTTLPKFSIDSYPISPPSSDSALLSQYALWYPLSSPLEDTGRLDAPFSLWTWYFKARFTIPWRPIGRASGNGLVTPAAWSLIIFAMGGLGW